MHFVKFKSVQIFLDGSFIFEINNSIKPVIFVKEKLKNISVDNKITSKNFSIIETKFFKNKRRIKNELN